MGFLDSLTRMLEKPKFKKLTQNQCEAVADTLAFAMLVDGQIAGGESTELTAAAGYLPWPDGTDPDAEVGRAIERARGYIEEGVSAEMFCTTIAERIESMHVREEIYYYCAVIIGSDDVIAEEETTFLRAIVGAFQLSGDSLRIITTRLQTERGL